MHVDPDPETLKQALARSNAKEWKGAFKSEIVSQIHCKTWEIVSRPKNRKVIGNRVVLSTKYNEKGEIAKRKVRLVGKGFGQKPGVDYNETSAPVVKKSSIRLLMALAVQNKFKVHQMDVVTAYLNGDLEEQVYMELPEQLEETLVEVLKEKELPEGDRVTAQQWLQKLREGGDKVCLLKKSLYGLKQSGLQWYRKLDEVLRKIGMRRLESDPCVYRIVIDGVTLIIAVYVDDILIMSESEGWIRRIKKKLQENFKMVDMGKLHNFLKIEFHHDEKKGEIHMKQTRYIQELIKKFKMTDCKTASTPMEPKLQLRLPEKVNESEMAKLPYRQLIGSLMYLSTSTRPDISFAISYLSQFNHNYSKEHWLAAKRVLRYLKATPHHGLAFSASSKQFYGAADADWASNVVDRRSWTGYAFLLGGASISWEARKQKSVAMSSAESEYVSLGEATKEALHLRRVLRELQVPAESVKIVNDSQSAQAMVRRARSNFEKIKHIDLRHHFIREELTNGSISLDYLETSKMPADVLTKSLGGPSHRKCIASLGVKDRH